MSKKNNPSVFILNGNQQYRNFMKEIGFVVKTSFSLYSDMDLLMLTGGTDINPIIYGEKKISTTGTPDRTRDNEESHMVKAAKETGIPIFGICRGAQLICALSGGTIIQHISGHNKSHRAILTIGKEINVTSSHHQMMNPDRSEHKILAVSSQKLSYGYETCHGYTKMDREYEAIYFPRTRALAVQWHPEWVDPKEEQAQIVKHWVHNLVERRGF